MDECINDWFRLAHEGSISWRSVADMCSGAYQVSVSYKASSEELNNIALYWEQANQEASKQFLSLMKIEEMHHA